MVAGSAYRAKPLTRTEANGSYIPAIVVTGLVSGDGSSAVATANTAAINAALTTAAATIGTGPGGTSGAGYGAKVQIPAGKFYWDGAITVPNCVDLIGSGKNATLLLAYSSSSAVVFGSLGGGSAAVNYGGESGHFRLEGRSLATNPLAIGLCGSRHFSNIRISLAVGDGLRVEQAQNCLFTQVDSENNGASGVVLDYGAGGNLFSKCEFSANGYANGQANSSGVVTGPGYGLPTHNKFDHCYFEAAVAGAVAMFAVDSSASLWFEDCVLSLNPGYADLPGANIPVIRLKNVTGVTGAACQSIYIGSGTRIVGSKPAATNAYVGYGIQVENGPTDAVASVIIGEQVIFDRLDTLFRTCATARIDVIGRFTAQNFTNRFGVTDAGSQTEGTILVNRGGQADFTTDDAAKPTLILRSAASQSANVLEQRNSAGTLVINASASGSFTTVATSTANRFAASSRGTTGTPAWSFGAVSDQGTGIYSQGSHGLTLLANSAARVAIDDNGVAFNGSTPVVKAASPGVAAGTDATVINAIITVLRNLGFTA